MRTVFSTPVILVAIISPSLSLLYPIPEDAKLNFTELGIKYGHSVKEHDVVTEDGYILTLFHIPGEKKGPILLMHGLLSSADEFIFRGKLSLAITLADQGYDVWAGNTRGNLYSRRHICLDPDVGPEFWNFSFHEGGYYDLPATIDFILDTTGEQSIRTIGHSQGTTVHFVLLSTRPEYNKKVKGLIALAPVAFLSNLELPGSALAEIGPLLNILKLFGIEELFRNNSATSELIEVICSQGIISYDICNLLILSSLTGYDPKRIEPEFWEIIVGHFPAATSVKNLMHLVQVALSKRFAYYDNGVSENLRRYKLSVPPSYNLGKITANMTLIVGLNDKIATIKDVDIIRSMLPRQPKYHVMEPPEWNHVDFVAANDMDIYLYPYLFSSLQDYE